MGTKRRRKRPIHGPAKKTARRSFESPLVLNSALRGQRAFQWLLGEVEIDNFFADYFEKTPFHLSHGATHFSSLLDISQFRLLVESEKLKFGSELDVTSYSPEGGRLTHNGDYGSIVNKSAWKKYESGCSLRLLRPQQHCDGLWSLCSLLESYFLCMVGANSYLTPKGTQGFAPHFDDIDAFVCQIHGKKRWRVYKPMKEGHDVLPRASSIDFTAQEMKDRPLALDITLQPGDVLYMPRGAIHEASAVEDSDSLHITLSVHQKWTWADLLLATVQDAIKSTAAADALLRRTLPLRFTEYVGLSKTDANEKRREQFDKMVRNVMKRVGNNYPIDAAADIMAQRFLNERLPPAESLIYKRKSDAKVKKSSLVRAVAKCVARVVMGEDGLPRIVHCLDNHRATSEERKATQLTCTPEEAQAVDFVLGAYPKAVTVDDIPLDEVEDSITLVEGLIEMGIACLEE